MANEFIIKNGFHSKGDSEITGSVKVNGGGSKEASLGNNILNENITNYKLNTVEGLEQYAGSFPFPSPGQGVKIITNPGGRDVIHTTSTTTTKYEVNQAYFQVYYNNTSNSSTMKIDSDYNLNTSTFNVSSSNFHITPSSSLTTITDPSVLYYTSSFSILNNSISGSIISGSSTTTLSRTHNSSKDLVTNGTSTSFNNIENNITQLKSSTPSTNEESYLNISPGEIDLKFNNTSNSKNSRLSLLESGVSLGKFNATGNNGNGNLFIGNNNLNLTYSSGSNSAAVILDPDYLFLTGGGGSTFNISSSITFTDNRTTKKGIEYDADYSANFTNRSLIDKEYVVDYVAASGSADTIYTADGSLTGDRTVDLNGNKLTFNIGATGTDDRFVIDGSSVTANDTDIFTIQGISNKLTVNEDGYIKNENVQNNEALYLSNSAGSYGIASRSVNNMFVNTNQYFVDTFGSTNYIQVYSQDPANGIRWVKQGNVQQHWIRSGNLDRAWFFMDGLSGTSGFIVGASAKIGTEDISLQGDTLISKKLELSTTTDGFLMPRLTTAQKNAISSPDTNLMVFDTDLSSLQRYNGSAWVDVAAGVGIIQLTQEGGSGGSVFYTDIQSALTAANSSGGDITITLHDNITTTAAISTNVTTNIDNITFDLNGFTITNTANDSSQVIFNKLQSNIITIINGSIIKTTGTGDALHFSSGIGDLYMSNCYVYSEAGSALKINASVTPINIWELGNSTFKTNTGYGVYLADTLGGVSLTNFISISTGSGMACFLNAGGDVTNFKAIAEGTGTALRVRSVVTSATNFYAESNSGNCVLLESLNPMVKDFTAISISGYAIFSSASSYKIENFYCKTTSGTRTLNVTANSILINGDVFSDSTDCAFVSSAERVENVNFTTNSGANNVVSRFTTNWINCTFRNKDGVAFYNYGSSTSKLKKCTFISEKTSGGSAHAANIVDGASVVTFVNCDFEVADSTVNCIKANAAMDMKVANCSFDNSATPLSSNITLNYLEADAYGNVTT